MSQPALAARDGAADVVALLQTLVAFPTVSSAPNDALAGWLGDRCEDLGFAVSAFVDPEQPGKRTLLARVGPDVEGGLVLSGHTDVVPCDGQPWTSDPFALTRRDGRLLGRGTADMKGFVAATLAALAGLDLARARRPLVLVWTHDEEVGCRGSALLAQALRAAPGGPQLPGGGRWPRACWIGEPTSMQVLHAHAGHVAVEVACGGRAGHSAYPARGANAVVAAVEVVRALLAAQPRLDAVAQAAGAEADALPVPLNIASVHGGDAINIIPDAATLRLGLRPPPGCDHLPLWRCVEQAVADAALPAGTSASARLLRVTPSLRTPPATALQQALAPFAATPALGTASYATDGGNLAQLGCQPLIFGPGSIHVAHQADEFIAEDELRAAVEVIAAVVARWLELPAGAAR